jgi:hypothetical protein
MKIIREFSRFVASYKPINLYIKGQSPIIIDENKAREKELLIRSIIKNLYPEMKSSDAYITSMGVDLRTDLLNKAQKNIAILYEIVDIAKENRIKIETADNLIEFISKNSTDLFKVGGKFFDRIYARLEGVSKKGKDKESISDELFQRYAKSKGRYVNLKPPGTSDEDIRGVDSFFSHGDKKYTIQTKTLSSISKYKSGEYYRVYISGYFTDIKTNYLVLIPEKDSSNKKYIFKGKNVKTLTDMRGVNYYSIPSSDLLYTED